VDQVDAAVRVDLGRRRQLVDRRAPPKSWQVPETWRALALGVRRGCPDAGPERVRAALVAQYGPEAALSDSQLRQLFREAGLPPGL
jgi:hypothetical protein